MHFNMKSNERLLWNYLLLRYFKGRNCCGKKLLRRKSTNFRNFFFRNNVIFHNSQLFLPQQYNLSQFASFFPAIYTLRILIDVPQLTNFFTSFALPSPTLYSNNLQLFLENESSQHLMPATFCIKVARKISQLSQLFLPATIVVHKVIYFVIIPTALSSSSLIWMCAMMRWLILSWNFIVI